MDLSKEVKMTDGSANYEEAISLAGRGKFSYLVMFTGGFAMMISLLATVDVTYVLPSSECELKLEKKDRGTLSGAYFIGIIVSSHLLGFLSDTLGRRYILVRSLITNIFVYIIASISPNFWALLISRFITGIVLCGVLTCGLVYVGEFHSNKHRTQAVMALSSLAVGAFVYCAALGWLILPNEVSLPLFGLYTFTPWRLYYILLGVVPSIIVGTTVFFLPESPKYLLACGKSEEALEILKKMYSVNTGNPKDQYPVKTLVQNPNEQVSQLAGKSKTPGAVLQVIWNQTYPLFMPPHVLNMLFSCTILFSLFFSFSGINIWAPDIINQVMIKIQANDSSSYPVLMCKIVESNWTKNIEINEGLNASIAEEGVCRNTLKVTMFQLNSVTGVVLSVCIFLTSLVLPKIHRKAFVAICCFLTIVIYGVLLEVPNYYIILLCLSVEIILLNIIFCATTTLLVDYFPTNFRGMAVCLAIMSGRLGSAVGGGVFSAFLLTECRNVFYGAGIIMLVGAICCLSLQSPKGKAKKAAKKEAKKVIDTVA